MAINPGSDIVLEVAKAADPSSVRAAASRLQRLAGVVAPPEETFAQALDRIHGTAPLAPHLPFDPALALVRLRSREALAQKPARAAEQFEAFVLQTFVQSMLPRESAAVFGSGTAGEIWRSMLAEQLGTQLARTGGIGIAAMLDASLSAQSEHRDATQSPPAHAERP
jgi:peptidoglycan hydrolase FlgJ